MAKCIICGGALWHTEKCPMRDHPIHSWQSFVDAPQATISHSEHSRLFREMYRPTQEELLDRAVRNTRRFLEFLDTVSVPMHIAHSPHFYHMNGPESPRELARGPYSSMHFVIDRNSDAVDATRYPLERIKNKMRQAVVWTDWEDAARRNKRNG